MKVMNVTETESGVTLRYRALPAALRALFFAGFIGFGTFCVVQVWPDIRGGKGSWLPPLDRLPEPVKQGIIFASIGIALLICLIPLFQSVRILLWGERWEIDVLRNLIIRDGEEVGALNDIVQIMLEGDFRDEASMMELYLLKANGKKVKIIQAMMYEEQVRRFDAAAQLLAKRTKLSYRKSSLGTPEGWWR